MPHRASESQSAPPTSEAAQLEITFPAAAEVREELRRATLPPLPPTSPAGAAVYGQNRVWSLLRPVLRLVDFAIPRVLTPFRQPLVRWALVTAAAVAAIVAIEPARTAVETAVSAAGKPFHDRAAFSFLEQMADGPTEWMDAKAVTATDSGAVLVHGVAWNKRSIGLKDYEMSFTARIDRKAIGWAVRAAKPRGYYIFKLVERGRGQRPGARHFELVRYLEEDGRPAARPEPRGGVPLELYLPETAFLDISVRVTEEQILTIVNGFGVDTWKLKESSTGGAGLVAEDGEAFLLRSVKLSGNEDFLGLFLWGTEETFRAVWRNLSAFGAHAGRA